MKALNLLAVAGLALPAVALAQADGEAPQVATVPWVAAQHAIPHDIISGVATRLKGAEIGQPGEGVGAAVSVTVEMLTTCSASTHTFSLNGQVVATPATPANCSCTPGVTSTAVVDPAVLAAWDPTGHENNVARYTKSGGGSYLTWARMVVTGADGSSARACIYDRTGGDCQTTNLCSGYDNQARDVSSGFQSAPDAFSSATYEWDFGDGTSTGPLAVGDARALEASHTYVAAPGTPFNATLTVCDADGDCASDVYPMVVRADSLEARTNVAIDEGLWYLHKQAIPTTGQIRAAGSHGERVSATASAVNAFEVHGHLEAYDRTQNPYVDTVARGLDYLFDDLQAQASANKNAGNPDSNGNGRYLTISTRGQEVYETGMVMDAIVASGNPAAVARTGVAAGETYLAIVQDLIDGYAQGQLDSTHVDRGSWTYNFYSPSRIDNSAAQWAAIGMIPAERQWGATVPAFVKTENMRALERSFVDSANACAYFKYDANRCAWGCAATTPSGLVQLVMDGYGPGDAVFSTNVQAYDKAARWIATNWGTGAADSNSNHITGYTYAMFAAVKALRLAGVDLLVDEACNAAGDAPSFDWYADPTRGVAKTLTSRQNANGSFGGPNYTNVQGITTQWSLIMLAPQLFQQGPKAVAQADPTHVTLQQTVTFDHGSSFHLDPARTLVTFEWDFDGDGTYDYSTNDIDERPTHAYNPPLESAFPVVYTARLRVTDDNDPSLSDTADVEITVDINNVPPVAVIDPANSELPMNTVLTLDGSASFDPNAGEPLFDSIVRYEWDTDDSDGLTQFVEGGDHADVQFAAPGIRRVALRVTDSGPGGTAQLTHVAFATIEVLANQPPVAVALPDEAVFECTGPAGAEVTLNGSDSMDPDPGDVLTYAWSPAAGLDDATAVMPTGAFALGAHGLTLTVTDTAGASDEDDASFTVVDTAAPELVCHSMIAECTGVATDVDVAANASDLCGGDLAPVADDEGPFALGETPVTFTATDASGNAGSCVAIATVVDTTAPGIDCFDGQAECTGPETAVEIGAAAQDICDPMVDLAGANPGVFGLGSTAVTYTATDDSGNASTCDAVATVVDTTAPAIACPADVTVEADAACVGHADPQASAEDVCDGAPSVSRDPAGTEWALGSTEVTHTAVDGSGNASSCGSTVTVVDVTPPTVECNASDIVPSDVPVSFSASAADNCSVELEITGYDCWKINGAGRRISKLDSCVVGIEGDTVTVSDAGGVGTHIEWTVVATDGSGNSTEVTCGLEVGHPGNGSGCNQGVGNDAEGCDPGNSNQGDDANSNDENGGTPGNPGKRGGRK